MKRQNGFTLIEAMIAVALIGILLAVGLPSYRWVIKEGNRSAAKQMMAKIVLRQALYLEYARAYNDNLGPSGLNLREKGWDCSAPACENANFSISIENVCESACDGLNFLVPRSFTIRATAKPSGTNAGEEDLTIDQAGRRTGPWE